MERAIPNGEANPDFEATFATFREHYMHHSLDTTRPYQGVPEVLAELKARGCRLAVVSNKMMAATVELCRHFFPDTTWSEDFYLRSIRIIIKLGVLYLLQSGDILAKNVELDVDYRTYTDVAEISVLECVGNDGNLERV